MGYSADAAALTTLLRSDRHGFGENMIPDEKAQYLAAFLADGLEDMDAIIDFNSGNVAGDTQNGAASFQTTCAACHGFDGRALDWRDADEPGYIGTEANANPWEVLHKIRNGHPGVEMFSLRAFDLQNAIDVLAHTRALPEE
jgi:thiosulfate dehydrogenase